MPLELINTIKAMTLPNSITKPIEGTVQMKDIDLQWFHLEMLGWMSIF